MGMWFWRCRHRSRLCFGGDLGPRTGQGGGSSGSLAPTPSCRPWGSPWARLVLLTALAVIGYGIMDTYLQTPAVSWKNWFQALDGVNETVIELITQDEVATYIPPTVVPPSRWVRYNRQWHGYQLPVITCQPLGRFGNVMGEYATLYALRRMYNASVVVTPAMRSQLNKTFPRLSLPSHPDYAFEIQLFKMYKEELKREFTFSDIIQLEVRNYLQGVVRKYERRSHSNNATSPSSAPAPPVFVGFHIRRTDYVKHAKKMFGAKLPGEEYFNRALNYYRTRFPNKVVFIAASDDMAFIHSKLKNEKDVYYAPGKSASVDMALLSSCNHSIVTMGSFGFWTGYLAGGEVVYPDVKLYSDYRFSKSMYERVRLENFTPLPAD
ncbi:galactoside alpha-(1,2)-fucosyltransferase 2-like isoform X3 [Penaeus chinensis]|uniref:galactoside alpha-(1,2)-fucosyltransferase 2-like isoform X3 n=1 Tax=Penaeus chinensis TaxID=139456 RepID=UPI001FB5BF63|nr:galactoside alpha-(1,2)-fucosyltransferase 2-like isoform X3 [Penaeus chinensis]